MNTIVTSSTGDVEGREKEGVVLFAGIPYAAPPVGELRFKAPRPHEPWDGVRPAQRFGPAAPQIAGVGIISAPLAWDEDCLTLNVSTPAVDSHRRPVMVWIHGGGYRTGKGGIPWYNGTRFGENGDIVVVTINYRLGALGFTHLARFGDEYATSGINGILDQIAALEWVQHNIEAFGGDPDNVTIAGESAGAFSVATLLGLPRANGLFHKAIAQSGAAHHTLPLEAAEKVADLFCDSLGVRSAGDLQSASVDDILSAQAKVDGDLARGIGLANKLGVPVGPFYPVVEGSVLPIAPLEAIRQGASSDVPLIIGTNRHETTLWGYGDVDEKRLREVTALLGGDDQMSAAYRAARPGGSARDALTAISTDHLFRIPAIRVAEARESHGGRTWMYLFAWESRAFHGKLKATHALEIPFVFDNLDRGGVDVFLGEGPKPQHVAAAMHAAWTSFIHTGNPNGEALPDWPAYDSERRATVVFDDVSDLVDDPSGAERRLWDTLR